MAGGKTGLVKHAAPTGLMEKLGVDILLLTYHPPRGFYQNGYYKTIFIPLQNRYN
jgi:hypothetical protein